MERKLFKNLSPEDRFDHFQANADSVEIKVYQEPLSHEELIICREKFADVGLNIARIEDEKKAMVEDFKSQLDPLKTTYKTLIQEIKTGQREKEGRLFKMVDREKKQVGFYSEDGNLIMERPATREEITQLTIHGLSEK